MFSIAEARQQPVEDHSRLGVGLSAKSIITTMLGEFVLPADAHVWTGTIIDGITALGFSERNVRQAVSRLGDDGVIESERHGRRARWRLTEAGIQLLASGTERIYTFGQRSEHWDGSWVVVICQIPETRRQTRHQFRSRMAFEGFGFLTPTVALSPHRDREVAANDVLKSLGLDTSAVVFRASTGMLSNDDELLAEAWDLDALAREYTLFVERFKAIEPVDGLEAFTSTVLLVDSWRRFPFLDPELPDGLVPDDWVGITARLLFDQWRSAWQDDARRWFGDRERASG